MRVTHDMIEIISHPGPDRSVTIEGLKEYRVYSRRYRNRRIGDFLKDRKRLIIRRSSPDINSRV